jgi:hypothetical protein
MTGTRTAAAIVGCCLIFSYTSTSQAGILNGHAAAFGGWTGSVAFDTGTGLAGDIDYAVFTAAAFNANFSGLGYVPGDALVYTYQISNTGTDTISAEIVGIANAANTIGTFDIGDVNASSASFIGLNAQWVFSPGVPGGQTSWGLAFSSPNVPMIGAALTLNGGSSALVAGVPTPSNTPIPEPASLALLAAAAATFWLRRQRG